jgi:U2 small nuclear ribonucleoprotein B''
MALTAPPGSNNTALQQRIPPNQSIYVQNLPEKIQKDDLRRELYILFSTYGPVIDVTALKNAKMRGQAHVLFKDVQCATQAMRSCQGFDFFGREMVRPARSANSS